MRALVVNLDYGSSVLPQYRRDSSLGTALPVKVLDADGTIIADALTSQHLPAEFNIPDDFQTVFVRLTWPSGKTETQRVTLSPNSTSAVTFSDANIARNEWSTWAIPLLNSRASAVSVKRPSGHTIEDYLKVWIKVWQFEQGKWHSMPIIPRMQFGSDVARQVDLELDAKPHILQVGGSAVPWRFVALPSSGPCRILLTPNDSKDPRADRLKIVVSSFRTDAETLLEFLARDEVRAANTMANSVEMAVMLFKEKFHDPIAAVAGAYYLLRIDDWDRVPLWWWENLSRNFPWIPDTAIVHCVRLLRAGLEDELARVEAVDLFKRCLDRGWPVYEEGLQLLQEAGSLLRHIADRGDAEYFAKVESLVTAKVWAGAAFSFYGKVPSKPSAVLWVGMPNAPRRRRLARPEWLTEVIKMNQQMVEDPNQTTASKVSRQISSLSFAQEFVAQRLQFANMASPRQRPLEIAQTNESRVDKKAGDWLVLGDIGN